MQHNDGIFHMQIDVLDYSSDIHFYFRPLFVTWNGIFVFFHLFTQNSSLKMGNCLQNVDISSRLTLCACNLAKKSRMPYLAQRIKVCTYRRSGFDNFRCVPSCSFKIMVNKMTFQRNYRFGLPNDENTSECHQIVLICQLIYLQPDNLGETTYCKGNTLPPSSVARLCR